MSAGLFINYGFVLFNVSITGLKCIRVSENCKKLRRRLLLPLNTDVLDICEAANSKAIVFLNLSKNNYQKIKQKYC